MWNNTLQSYYNSAFNQAVDSRVVVLSFSADGGTAYQTSVLMFI